MAGTSDREYGGRRRGAGRRSSRARLRHAIALRRLTPHVVAVIDDSRREEERLVTHRVVFHSNQRNLPHECVELVSGVALTDAAKTGADLRDHLSGRLDRLRGHTYSRSGSSVPSLRKSDDCIVENARSTIVSTSSLAGAISARDSLPWWARAGHSPPPPRCRLRRRSRRSDRSGSPSRP